MRGAIGVVLDALYRGGNAVLGALEINHAVVLLVTTTNVAGGNAASVVTATSLGLFLQQRRVRTAFVQLVVRTRTW